MAENQKLIRPGAGEQVALPVGPDAKLEFTFNPGDADLSKDGQNFVLTFQDGAKLTLEGFYDNFGDNTQPPTLVMDGQELPGEQFLAALNNPDLMPAAGPAAGPALGGGSYEDALLAGVSGVDRLDKLVFDGWGRGTEPTEEFIGGPGVDPEEPGGTFSLEAYTELGGSGGGLFHAGLYEDGRAYQNLYGEADPQVPGRLELNFQPTGTTVVDGIHLTGFDAGTMIFKGTPISDGQGGYTNAIVVSGTDHTIDFTHADFTGDGVYILPPRNSDHDMDIDAVLDLRAASSDLTGTATTSFTIVVDAVADKPVADPADFGHDVVQQDHADKDHGRSGEAQDIKLDVKTTFGDVLDGSEKHYFDVGGIPSEWEPAGTLPAGWTIVGQTDNGDGTYTLRIDVSAAATADARANGTTTGTVDGELHFNPKDWTSSGIQDAAGNDVGRHDNGDFNASGPATITVTAVAVESAQDGELDINNNTARTEVGRFTVDLQEDVPVITQESIILGTNEKAGVQTGEMDFASLDAATQALANLQTTAPALGVDRKTFDFNLFSDGKVDGKTAGAAEGTPSVSFDSFPADGELFAKLPGDAAYTALTRESVTDANGNTTLTYSWTDAGGKHVALVVVLEPTFNANGTGEATMTVIQYAALRHETGLDTNDLPMNFTLRVTDNDGDSDTISAIYVAKDDIPEAGADVTAVFDEKIDTPISGNVLTKLVTDHDASNDNATYAKADSGSDGWEGGNAGVVGYTIALPAGYSIDGTSATMAIGTSYTILDAKGNAQGSFSLDAQGNWSFSSTGAQDVIKDFKFSVNYTVRDADGDTDTANLKIDVKAAPLMAGVTGDTKVFESELGTNGSVNDAAGVATYTIQAYNYDGGTAEGAALYEDMYVTLKISALGTAGNASLSDIDLANVKALNPGVVTGVNAAMGEITVKIPAGDADGAVQLKLPMADDSLGGFNTKSDGPVEHYDLKVTAVTGDTPGHYLPPTDPQYAAKGVNTTQGTDIIDDGTTTPVWNDQTGHWEALYENNRLDGAGAYNHKTDEHPLDGPMLKLGVTGLTNGALKEGSAASFTLGGTLNPNTDAGYTSTKVGENIELTLKVELASGASAADLTVSGMSATGATYQYYNGSSWVSIAAGSNIPSSAFDKNGVLQVKVVLVKGATDANTFDLADLSKVGLKITAVNDTLTESGEQFKVSITEAHGGESTYYGEQSTTTITEDHNGSIAIAGSQVLEGNDLSFQVKVTGTVINPAVAANADDVKVTFTFTKGSADFTDVDLSKDALQTHNPNITIVSVTTNPDGTVSVQAVINAGDWTKNPDGSYTYDLKVPTVVDEHVAEADEKLTVAITEVSGAEIKEITPQDIAAGKNPSAEGLIHDEATLSLRENSTIHEDSRMGATVAEYHIDVADKGIPVTQVSGDSGKVAGQGFTFDITLKDGTATFDPNMTDNINSDGSIQNWNGSTGAADYGWAIDGKLIQYHNLNTPEGVADLKTAINDYLAANGYDGITVTGVTNGGRTLTFSVDKGADIDKLESLPIQVGAIDDAVSDSGEKYKVILSNIQEKGTDDGAQQVDSITVTNRQVETTILDDQDKGYRDGYLVGVQPAVFSESSDLTGNAFKGDGFKIPVLLFDRNSPDGTVLQSNPPTQAITIVLNVNDGSAKAGQDYYLNGDQAQTVTVQPSQWVFVPAAGGVPAHWEFKVEIPRNDDRLTEGDETFSVSIKSTSGHESSAIPDGENIGGIKNNADMKIVDDTSLGPNQYDANGNLIVAGALDGPELLSFGPNGKVIEPKAPGIAGADANGEQINETAAVNPVEYKIVLDAVAAQDIVVFIKVDELPKDFRIPAGSELKLLTPEALAELQGLYGKYNIDPKGAGYYLVIKEGLAEGSFEVEILHDHDTANNQRGVDPGVDKIHMEITNMQGSEVRFDPKEPLNTSDVKIEDDMRGPVVHLDAPAVDTGVSAALITLNVENAPEGQGAWATVQIKYNNSSTVTEERVWIEADANTGQLVLPGVNPQDIDRIKILNAEYENGDKFKPGKEDVDWTETQVDRTFTLKADIPVAVTEAVTVTIEITHSDGTTEQVHITIPAGQLSGSITLPSAGKGDYIYTQVVGSSGGETQHDPKLNFTDLTGPGGPGGQERITLGIEASENIREQGETSVEYTISGHIPDSHTQNGDLSFTIKVINQDSSNGDFKESGPGHDVTVTIPKELLDAVGPGGDFKVVITNDASGNPVATFTDTAGNPITVPGHEVSVTPTTAGDGVAQAYDDKLIEGTETFTSVITGIKGGGPGGATIDSGKPLADTNIIDNDIPELKVTYWLQNADGTFTQIDTVTEGDKDVFVKVELVDAAGNPLTLSGGYLTIDLTKGGGTATEGADFSLPNNHLVIDSGQNSAMVKLLLPNDYKSEDPADTLVIKATVDPAKSDHGVAGQIQAGSSGSLTINDLVDGPNLRFTAGASTMYEDGAMTFSVTLDKALEENATLTFKVDLAPAGTDTKDGFTLSDIKSITVDGTTYKYDPTDNRFEDPDGNDASAKIHLDGNGDIIFTMVMNNGSSKETFSVQLNNDKISENNEHLNITLTDAKGGELCIDGTPFANVADKPVADVTVKDVLDGPTVTLTPHGEGTEGESVSVQLTLTGKSDSTVSDTDITLKLGPDVLAKVVEGDKVSVYDGNNNLVGEFTINLDGTMTIHLAEGVKGPLTLTFPLQDNAVEGPNVPFSISLSGIVGGECTVGGVSGYSSSVVAETDGSLTFELDGSASKQDAQATITIDGIPGDNAAFVKDVIVYDAAGAKIATIPGTALTVVDGKLTYILPDAIKANASLDGAKVVVEFDKTRMTDPADIAAAKLNAVVGLGLEGKGLTIPVNEDTLAKDGPVFTVDAPADGVEGASVVFTINPNEQAGFETTEQDISLTFKLTGGYAGRVVGLVLSPEALAAGLQLSGPVGGQYTIKLPAGTELDNWDGAVTATLNSTDAKIGASGSLGIQLTGTSGGESTLGATVADTATIADATRGTLSLNVSDNVAEGGDIFVKLNLADAADNALTATQPITVTLQLSGVGNDPATDADLNLNGWTRQADGAYTREFTLPANTASSTWNIPVKVDTVLEHNEGVRVEVISTNIPAGIAGNITNSAAGASFDITIRDAGGARMVLEPLGDSEVVAGSVGGLGFNLNLQNAAGQAMTAVEALVVSFIVSGFDPATGNATTLSDTLFTASTDTHGNTWSYNGSGTWTVTATLPTGANSLTINAEAAFGHDNAGIVDAAEGLRFTLDGLSGHDVNCTIVADGVTVTPGTHLDFTVVDADYAAATGYGHDASLLTAGAHVVDASHSYTGTDAGETILGTDAADTIHGGGGNDVIHGGAGDDVIHGGAGDDLIYGGTGNDTLTGGAGADTFAWKAGDMGGTDTITDFNQSEGDKLRFEDLFGSGGETTLNNLLNSGIWEANPEGSSTGTFSAVNGSNSISLHLDGTNASLTVSGDTGSQTVALNNFAPDLTSGSETQQIHDMLQQIIKVTE